ncbi:hypothetical protein BPIT_08430 [Candidatus Brocadia pituitae]|nr:hypothetical protein BPIT_08430 [Candidatus Brocadia pituitae]
MKFLTSDYFPVLFSEEVLNRKEPKSKKFSVSEEKLENIRNEMKWLLEKMEVTNATRHKAKLNKSPGIVSVIMADERV